ncbi:MAG TPA: VOC family protein [Jatrophihabitantaceae bacterium]|jgi:catechol 2,3-dioxygenase-like lactoylglutathione lyase family enzyme|nr:VOC family protein [Jatrophihabitantaceae bacterium]
MATLTLTTVNVGTPDPQGLARFYERLLGWPIAHEEPGFVIVRDPAGGVGVSFQLEEGHVPPAWPAQPGDQQMQLHLEIRVDDLEGARSHAVECGASVAEFQPQDDVRVCLDPAGHPFCLYLG